MEFQVVWLVSSQPFGATPLLLYLISKVFLFSDFAENTLARVLFESFRVEVGSFIPESHRLEESDQATFGYAYVNENERVKTKRFYDRYGICMTLNEVASVLSLAMKMSVCRVEWKSQAERVFRQGIDTQRDLYDLYHAIKWRMESFRRIQAGDLPNNYQFVFHIVR